MNENLSLEEQHNLLVELRNKIDLDDLEKMCTLADREEAARLERLQRADFLDSDDSDDCGYSNKGDSYRRARDGAERHEQQRDLARTRVLEHTQTRVRIFDEILKQALDPVLASQLTELRVEIEMVSNNNDAPACAVWWASQGQNWKEKLDLVTIS